jgi:hypothetical protein
MWFKLGGWLVSFLTGGSLQKILDVIDSKMDNDTRREELKADVTKTWIQAQVNLLVGRTWWFQLFFVIPLGLWWTSVILDSIFLKDAFGHTTYALPAPLDTWAGWIISALFVVDGGKALLGRFTK